MTDILASLACIGGYVFMLSKHRLLAALAPLEMGGTIFAEGKRHKGDMMIDFLDTFVHAIGFMFAPIHELGHVIFGWLTLNPTFIISWNQAESMIVTHPWLMLFGGVFTELVFYWLVAFFVGKKTRFIYPWTLALTLINLMSIWFQTDQDGYGPLMPALWYATGVISIVWQIYLLKVRKPKVTRKQPAVQSTMPKDARAYLAWLNSDPKEDKNVRPHRTATQRDSQATSERNLPRMVGESGSW